MNEQERFANIIETFIRMINKFTFLENRPMDYGAGDMLRPSEIHTLDAVGRYPGMNSAAVADVLGVMESDITGILTKLKSLNLMEKEADGGYVLTEKGEAAHAGLKEFHKKLYGVILGDIRDMEPAQVEFVEFLFNRINHYFDDFIMPEFEK